MAAVRKLLVTDLDNTLWDWFHAWYVSFSTILCKLVDLSGVPQTQLEAEIRAIHQARGTTEYSNLVNEVPSLARLAAPEPAAKVYFEAIAALHVARRTATKLYPNVHDTLSALKQAGVRLASVFHAGVRVWWCR
jgi:phosphoglycolate phosphatase